MSADIQFTLVTVASGARSLRSLEHAETFHPVVGPMAEAHDLHVAQSRLVERAAEKADGAPFVVWDIGLGAAANAVAVLNAFRGRTEPLELHSFDITLDPLAFARSHAEELGYLHDWVPVLDALLTDGVAQAGAVKWILHLGDFREWVRQKDGPLAQVAAPDAILYDPYSPKANPGLWTLEHFTALRSWLTRPCTFTSYSRSTAVRVSLALAGFHVGRGGATGEKDETTVVSTERSLLKSPLGSEWLGRVSRSTKGGPLREGRPCGPIEPEELAALERWVGN